MASSDFFSLGIGVGTKNAKGEWLEVFFAAPVFAPNRDLVRMLSNGLDYRGGNVNIDLTDDVVTALVSGVDDVTQIAVLERLKSSKQPRVLTLLETDTAIESTPEAYLKLHLLSHRYVKPHGTNLERIFAKLPNVAWTSEGAVDPQELPARQLEARAAGKLLTVSSLDKFPRMTDYVVPSGVRIAHSARVRLGAYLGEGTTVMHEGFVNFNAGAMGPNMVEGRLSQGVTMDAGSDLGGGASTMGTLSGGGDIVLSLGKDCLVGANGGTGIPLGDRCTIEAGLYITASTVVQVLDENRNFVRIAKARELAGKSDMLFIRNSQTGMVECRISNKPRKLNEALHSHN